ncbi:hypothetical protein ZHAS_00017844 [Anopheles sinensis]|uniref:C2H2-type domain-containing protein n=1 Tax=Anopheles sinensis TaxID=74873 RepID=A0A084WHY0_ANOSI|nr:hypothetical protein ZHAS_00017844 [Anopheles sinensis]
MVGSELNEKASSDDVPGPAEERRIEDVETSVGDCLDIETQRMDETTQDSEKLPLVASEGKLGGSLEGTAQTQDAEQQQIVPDEVHDDQLEESRSDASVRHDFPDVEDDLRHCEGEKIVQTNEICDRTSAEEDASSRSSPTQPPPSDERQQPEAEPTIGPSLVVRPTARLLEFVAETPAESSLVDCDTICDTSNTVNEQTGTVSDTLCMDASTIPEAEAIETREIFEPEPSSSIEVLHSGEKEMEQTSTRASRVLPVSSMNKSTRKKGKKRPAKSSPASSTTRPAAKRKKQVNLQHIKPSSPPVFDSSEAPVSNEVVSDCSTDGFSAVERPSISTQERDEVEVVEVSKVAQSDTAQLELTSKNNTSNQTISEGKDESLSKMETEERKSNAKKKVGRPAKKRQVSDVGGEGDSQLHPSRHDLQAVEVAVHNGRATRAAKRRKLKRKKRSTPRDEGGSDTDTPIVTASSTIDDITRAADTRTRRAATTFKRSKASKLSKAPNTDEQFVISEVAAGDDSHSADQSRVLEVINVRYQRTASQLASSNSTQQTPAGSAGIVEDGNPRLDPTTGETAPSGPGPVDAADSGVMVYKCGNCGKELHRSAWQEHFAFHNGVAFREGIDAPIDLQDVKAVGYAIHRFMKTNRRSEVICEKCSEVKKSHLGMASHLRTCGIPKEAIEATKATCEHCGRKMKVVSFATHQLLHCRVLREQRLKEAAEQVQAQPVQVYSGPSGDEASSQLSASGRKKRRSHIFSSRVKQLLIKVTNRMISRGILIGWLKEMKETGQTTCRHKGCFFVGTSEEMMRNHSKLCPYAGSTAPFYECAICQHQEANQMRMYDHVRQVHQVELNAAQNAPSDNESDANDAYENEMRDDGATSSSDMDVTVKEEELEDTDDDGKGRKRKQPAKRGAPKNAKATKSRASKNRASDGDDVLNETGVLVDEGEVYKEMVQAEAAELRLQRNNIQFTTIQWMFKFHREHYATRQLFVQLQPDVDVRFLTMLAIRDYLPHSIHSLRYQRRYAKHYDEPYELGPSDSWRQLFTFQGEVLDGEPIFYCGGPVTTLDWLPIPSDEGDDATMDQILAIACKSGFDDYYTCEQLSSPVPRKCLIQIWNVGPLRNARESKSATPRCPQLSFAIACDFGPIWQLSFCPSGCYNELDRGDCFDRLGLLAASGSDGDVYVYALNRSMVSARIELPDTKPTPRIVHLQPVLRLSLTLHNRSLFGDTNAAHQSFSGHAVMRIAWSRGKGHTVFAAGYSNGAAAVWKLTEASFNSPLLGALKDGIQTLLPTQKILNVSTGSVSAIDLHYGQGSRYLAVSNADRRLKVYDLHSGHHQPVEVLSLQARSRITALHWMLHYPVLVFVYDDVFLSDRCGYTVHQPREIGLRTMPLITLGTEATDLAVNEWISTNAISTDGGDVVSHRPIPFVTGIPGKNFGQLLTMTNSVGISNVNTSELDLSSYEAFANNFALVFSDTDKNPSQSDRKSLQIKTFRRGNIAQYPGIRVNQIRWNPNSSSFLYHAIGYQAGFVRIRKIQV